MSIVRAVVIGSATTLVVFVVASTVAFVAGADLELPGVSVRTVADADRRRTEVDLNPLVLLLTGVVVSVLAWLVGTRRLRRPAPSR
jgi:hypothetical protein